MRQNNISFIGAGRVGTSLCREIYKAGYKIELVVSENEINSKSLAGYCNAQWSSSLSFPASTNVIVAAVPDHKLKLILADLKCNKDTLVVHTAGSIGLDVFPDFIKHSGVFYPLQTFSKERSINFSVVPVLLESSDERSSAILREIAESISSRVYFVETPQRRMLHLAAVFVNNFTNHLLVQGRDIALKGGFPFEILSPLIQETISKALETGPENAQTGPAIRNDKNTIEKHMELLSFSPELKRIYNDLTRSIVKYYEKK